MTIYQLVGLEVHATLAERKMTTRLLNAIGRIGRSGTDGKTPVKITTVDELLEYRIYWLGQNEYAFVHKADTDGSKARRLMQFGKKMLDYLQTRLAEAGFPQLPVERKFPSRADRRLKRKT